MTSQTEPQWKLTSAYLSSSYSQKVGINFVAEKQSDWRGQADSEYSKIEFFNKIDHASSDCQVTAWCTGHKDYKNDLLSRIISCSLLTQHHYHSQDSVQLKIFSTIFIQVLSFNRQQRKEHFALASKVHFSFFAGNCRSHCFNHLN